MFWWVHSIVFVTPISCFCNSESIFSNRLKIRECHCPFKSHAKLPTAILSECELLTPVVESYMIRHLWVSLTLDASTLAFVYCFLTSLSNSKLVVYLRLWHLLVPSPGTLFLLLLLLLLTLFPVLFCALCRYYGVFCFVLQIEFVATLHCQAIALFGSKVFFN